MKKKVVLTALVLLAVFSMTAAANAAVFASEYINSYYANITKYSDGHVKVVFDINGTHTLDAIGVKTIVIQEKTPSSSTWNAVATLSYTDYSNMLAYNTYQHASSVSYYGINPNNTYRAKVYFYAEKGGYDTREYITSGV